MNSSFFFRVKNILYYRKLYLRRVLHMKIKETICTEMDERGRVIKRTRTVDIEDWNTDQGYDYGTRFGEYANPRQSSYSRIFEAYDDFRKSQQW